MRIALAQVDPTVGDISGNAALVSDCIREARKQGVAIVVLPELVVSGYPPEDLVLKDHFVLDCQEALADLAEAARGVVAVVGAPVQDGGLCYNAASVLHEGSVVAEYRKIWLPNYGVFDEKRYFTSGTDLLVLEVDGVRCAITICEDVWKPDGPGEAAAWETGASVILNLSMSPYHRGKGGEREQMLGERATAAGAYVCYANGVGGQDELVFDGQSVVLAADSRLIARASQFGEEMLVVDLDEPDLQKLSSEPKRKGHSSQWPATIVRLKSGADSPGGWAGEYALAPERRRICTPLSPEAEVYAALCIAVRDYTSKNGFTDVVVGVSGGIDSALTLAVAADALGAQRVHAVSMPSRYSSEGTKSDAREVAERLGVAFLEIPIEETFEAYLSTLQDYVDRDGPAVTVQNIQARIRGNILMALSNEHGWLVLTTGNKSEMAVGYATLYGDMAGGFAALKDVPKTLVYRLAEHRNSVAKDAGPIPGTTITRAPSAELTADQTDQDTLPPYEMLDRIIESYVVLDESLEEMVSAGLPEEVVVKVVAMIDGNEYKRRQAAPGVRITPKAFGKDRRLPITNRYRG